MSSSNLNRSSSSVDVDVECKLLHKNNSLDYDASTTLLVTCMEQNDQNAVLVTRCSFPSTPPGSKPGTSPTLVSMQLDEPPSDYHPLAITSPFSWTLSRG